MKRLFSTLVLVTALLISCDNAPTEIGEDSAPLFKKGGNKPGGGGLATPEIVFQTRGSDIAVMDADGGNVAVLLTVDDLGWQGTLNRQQDKFTLGS